MNKVLKMCLLTGVAVSLAACGNKDVTTNNEVIPEENKVEINQPVENPAPEVNVPVVDNETKPEEKPAEQKPEKEGRGKQERRKTDQQAASDRFDRHDPDHCRPAFDASFHQPAVYRRFAKRQHRGGLQQGIQGNAGFGDV